jgi:hypothetical protein
MQEEVHTIAERVASNQHAFRDANEQIEAVAEDMEPPVDPVPFLCECCRRSCTELLQLALEEYEAIRDEPTWFFVKPGHEVTVVDGVEIAEVIERREHLSVLSKVGLAGDLAEHLDERSVDG